ncbi:Protein kinase C-like [Actinidia chinensis var. chinensis]|uniref:Protein kinase C-like n=1 Tax=Actinidia chinensis var. chinensis TaxID=1590841 RepID=A0A2R6QNR5_ACTCC|nr:Protein kinase C-like [Actinidia chinensis var. chinensis]
MEQVSHHHDATWVSNPTPKKHSSDEEEEEEHSPIVVSYHEYHGHEGTFNKLEEIDFSPCFVCWYDYSSSLITCLHEHSYGDPKMAIHKLCYYNIPPKIDHHPFHPQHTLTLHPKPPYDSGFFLCNACGRTRWAFPFHCEECHFDLDVHCATMLMPINYANSHQIQHLPSHPHPLISCERDPNSNVPCSGCGKPIEDCLVYVCLHCKCLLDKSCAEWPSQIEHPFHPQHPLTLFVRPNNPLSRCSACGNEFKGFAFQCWECNFGLDVFCASLTPTQNYELGIDQPSMNHPHPLILCENKKNFGHFCSGCKHSFKEGCVYVCLHCKCLMDESCAQWPSQIEHPFHPQHPLKLLLQPPIQCDYSTSRCRACGKVLEAFTFHCSECKFSLGVCCASLIPTQSFEASRDEEKFRLVQQLGHPHSLILCEKEKDFDFVCYACQRCLKDWVYVCLECSILLHKSCANLPRKIYHSQYSVVHKHRSSNYRYFLREFCNPKHSLTLLEHSPCQSEEPFVEGNEFVWVEEMHPFHPKYDSSIIQKATAVPESKQEGNEFNGHFRCFECYNNTIGFAYACRECGLYCDIRCIIKYELDEHPLACFNIVTNKLNCKICARPLYAPFFRCEECNFNIHVSCLTILPQVVKNKFHRHTLTLTNSPVKDHPDEDENAEFYCDACEENRELFDTTYYCEECHLVAHVHCVVFEALCVLKEEWSLDFKLGETNLYTSSSVHDESNASNEASKSLMILEEMPGEEEIKARGDFSLIELDEEIAVLNETVKCLGRHIRETKQEICQVKTRLKVLKERRDKHFYTDAFSGNGRLNVLEGRRDKHLFTHASSESDEHDEIDHSL